MGWYFMSKKVTYEFVKGQFEKEGYILLSTEYVNSKHHLLYICPNGHNHSISWSNWNTGHRCSTCGYIRAGKLRGLDIDFVKSKFDEVGYKLLSTVYKGPHSKLKYICPKGHLCSTTWAKWYYADQKCVYCSKRPPIDFNDIKKSFEEEDYTLLSDRYKNGKKLKYICPNGHKGSMTWDNWKYNNRRCKKCSNNVSNFELEVRRFVSDTGVHYVPNDRSQLINPNTNCAMELDIWLPELGKAIECNGLYWHSMEERQQIDIIKRQVCSNRLIDLLIITDVEWKNNRKKIEQKIIYFLEDRNVRSYSSVPC